MERVLYDNHNRPLNYLRIAVTDRCNLRCFYCMPEEGIRYLPKKELLTFEEIEKLVSVLASMGISKIRLTGGEPFVRNDLMKLIRMIVRVDGISSFHITTNGVLTAPYLDELKELGVGSINLSLDTLDENRFKTITRRDEFRHVMATLEKILQLEIPLKINAVVMENRNIDDLIPLAELTRTAPVSVRFIEEMPFNGEGSHYPTLTWTHKAILSYLMEHYPTIEKIHDPDNSTSSNYRIPGYPGDVGIIAAFSRTFCGTCNRIRVTAQGTLKTCLYDDGVLSIRNLMRSGASDETLKKELLNAFRQRPINGFAAERNRKNHQPISESMSTIGG